MRCGAVRCGAEAAFNKGGGGSIAAAGGALGLLRGGWQAQQHTSAAAPAAAARRGWALQLCLITHHHHPLLQLLLNLAERAKLRTKMNAMFSGQHINNTEDRAVLHTALRMPRGEVGGRVLRQPVGGRWGRVTGSGA